MRCCCLPSVTVCVTVLPTGPRRAAFACPSYRTCPFPLSLPHTNSSAASPPPSQQTFPFPTRTHGRTPHTAFLLTPATGLLGDVLEQVEHTARVAVLVVVPAHQLDEVGRQGNAWTHTNPNTHSNRSASPPSTILPFLLEPTRTGLGVDDRGELAADEVGRHHVLVGVAQDALHGPL